MGSVRKKLGVWKGSVTDFLKRFFLDKKWLLQLVIIIFLLLISLFIYMKISTKSSYKSEGIYKSKMVNDAINQYRLDNYSRAEIIFKRIIEQEKNKDNISIAFLYLGNIMFKKNQLNNALEYYKKAQENREIGKYAWYNSAVIYLEKGNIYRAIKNVRTALKYDNLFVEADLLLGNLYYLKRDYQKALHIYSKYRYNPVFLYDKAITNLTLGDEKSAEEIFLSLISRKDIEEVIKGISYYELGNIYQDGDIKKAAFYYYQAYKFFNQNDDIIYNASIMMGKSGDYNKAAEIINHINIEGSTNVEKTAYGYILFKSGDYKKAYNILSEIEDKNFEANILLGEINLEKGNNKIAESFYSKALSVANNSWQRFDVYNHFILLYQKTGDLKKAVDICNDLSKKSENVFPILISCAKTHFEQGKDEKALFLMSKALSIGSNDRLKLFQLALVYLNYGYDNNALKVLYRIRDLYPDDYESLLSIARIFLNKGQRENTLNWLNVIIDRCKDIEIYYNALILKAGIVTPDEAESIYKSLIKDFPYRYEAYYNLARLYLLNKKYEKSVELIDLLLKEDIKTPLKRKLYGYIIKGIALYNIDRPGEAYRAFMKANSINNNDEIVRFNLNLIKAVNK